MRLIYNSLNNFLQINLEALFVSGPFAAQIEKIVTTYTSHEKFVVIDSRNKLKKICSLVKKDNESFGTNLIFDNKNFTVCLVNSDKVMSLISFKICKNKQLELGEVKCITDYIYINFTYTFVRYRQQGYNKLLRQLVENIAKELNVEYVVSLPFENASSQIVLKKMGYISDGNIYYKQII